MEAVAAEFVDYQTDPSQYRHWKLSFEGAIATLAMDTQEDGGIRPGYKLKLNSYDLGVDIELHDAIQRIRFEHPEVRTVVITSARQRVFCSGANIYMLGLSSHAWKVNFCKFTNETRNGIEDASEYSGLKFIAACNGSTAGGGYELALACDEIILIDDRSSAVSLPEIPLLGVLPGTGGLTRLTDKRKVRRDHADIFCTQSEGVQGQRAKDWRLVDTIAKPQQFTAAVKERAESLAALSNRPRAAAGVTLTPLHRTIDDAGYHYQYVDARFDRAVRTVTLTVRAPERGTGSEAGPEAGASWWPLQMARELDDAILSLRTNELELGLWVLKTEGDAKTVLAYDTLLAKDDWFTREVVGELRRTLARLEVSARSIYAVIEPGSCFAGTLAELALAADRTYMLDTPLETPDAPLMQLSDMNFGPLPLVNGMTRLQARFYGDVPEGRGPFTARDAEAAGLITAAVDELDWADEIRLAIESRNALSPDALSGMEANLRFGANGSKSGENMHTRVFGRLSAWQNWIFIRPNAVGPNGALKLYGTGNRAKFSWERV